MPYAADYPFSFGPDQDGQKTTIGLSRDDIQTWLDSKTPTSSVVHVWDCMLMLTNNQTDSKFVGAYLNFIACEDALEAFADWSAESRYAESLGLLGETIRSDSRVHERLLPFRADQSVKKRMAKQLESQYLAAAAAVRRPPGNERLAGFIAKVKALCFVRAMEALDDRSITHEKNLMRVCVTLRIACDHPNQPELNWFQEVSTWGTSLSDFGQSLDARCRAALRSNSSSQSERRLFSSLITVASGGPWVRHERYSTAKPVARGAPGWNSPPTAASLLWIASGEEGNEPVWTQTADGQAIQVQVQSANPVQTLERNRRDGAGVLIETVEAVQLLRHSWHHLTREDEDALFLRIGQLLTSERLADRLGGTYVLTAIIACLPWSAVGSLTISGEACDDWRFDPLTWELRRRPPRFARRWRADEKASGWIRPLAEHLRLRLPEKSTADLREAAGQSPPFDLAALWAQACPPDLTLEGWFLEAFEAGGSLKRLTGPALAHVLLVALHERRPNQAFARLVGSRARTGLPSACAYGAYSGADVEDAYAVLQHRIDLKLVAPARDPLVNAAGSELDLVLEQIRREINALVVKAHAAMQSDIDWLHRHNLITSLAVIALYASTGCRPAKSPFEHHHWIDLDRSLIYVEDKVAGPTRGGRLCVLSEFARDLLIRAYFPHLAQVALRVEPGAPDFAAQIRRQLGGDPGAAVPLFFFLRAEPAFDWTEVNEAALTVFSGLSWPLPWNLFRHCHSSQLVRMGLHPEIVAALLSHADRGAESHGDYSMRVPLDDLESARPCIEQLMAGIGFEAYEWVSTPLPTLPDVREEPKRAVDRPFGAAAREAMRVIAHAAAKEQALEEIETLIRNRRLDSLSADDWDHIASKMLFRETGGLPHPAASLRYSVLETFIDNAWRKTRVVARLKRRYAFVEEGESLFNATVVGAREKMASLTSAFEPLVAATSRRYPPARYAAVMAMIDLVLNSRLAHQAFLTDLLQLKPSIQGVRFQGVDWIEWSDAGVWRDSRPVIRVRASQRAASWIAVATRGTNQLREMPPLPPEVEPIAQAFCGAADLGTLLRQICRLQDQLNILELPGVDASYLAGRAVLASLPHRDWYRIHRVAAPDVPDPEGGADFEQEVDPKDVHTVNRGRASRPMARPDSTPEACAVLFEEIRLALLSGDSGACRTAVEKALAGSRYGPGDAPWVLGSYIAHLLSRSRKKKSANGRSHLRVSTVQRAWYALAGPVVEFAHDINLPELDESELTDLYGDIIDWWAEHFEESGPDPEEGTSKPASRLTREERIADASRRTSEQLREFHNFAQRAFGLEDPDWSEITSQKAGMSGRPGYVLSSEYLQGLELLQGYRAPEELPDNDLSNAVVWIVCGRFGARLGEAVGLYRGDWITTPGSAVVLVRSNHVRPIKTVRSKRQVPLVETLLPAELALVDEALRRWANRNRTGDDGPLLPDVDRSSYKARRSDIGEALRAVVRTVTRNGASTLHMLRHSYATRIFALLRGVPVWNGETFTVGQVDHARRLLLGYSKCDRRTMWAVCRLLGHASPAATLRSYIHSIESWLPGPSPALGPFDPLGIDGSRWLDLDAWPAMAPAPLGAVHSGHRTRQEPPLLRQLNFLRLLAQGYQAESASATSRVSLPSRIAFVDALNSAARRDGGREDESPVALRGVPTKHWDDLITAFGSVAGMSSPPPFDLGSTVGRRHQIVLFEEAHFSSFREFATQLGLDSNDVHLVPAERLGTEMRGWIKAFGLDRLLVDKKVLGDFFQLDTTQAGRHRVTDRVVAVRAQCSRRVANNQGLLAVWLGWNCAGFATAASELVSGSGSVPSSSEG